LIVVAFSAFSFAGKTEIEVNVENNPYSAWGAARIVMEILG